MYHQIELPFKDKFYVAPENFKTQMQYIKDNGFKSINPNKDFSGDVLITFDDGRIMLYTGENSPLRQHEGWDEEKNWRLRPACSDYGFC